MLEITHEDINIVYEDNHILVAVKPQNIPSCPDETQDPNMLDLLKQYLVESKGKQGNAYLGLVHRLDRPTGGVMVFAKTSKAAARISENIRDGELEKRYLAITVGALKNKQGTLTDSLYKDEAKNEVYCVPMATEGAKLAVLDYRTLEVKEQLSLVQVKLITGRGHQARVQLANQGAPIFGDVKYGKNKMPAGYNLALWAYELRFPHPVSKETLLFRVFPPTEEIPWKYFEIASKLAIIK